MFLYRTVFIPVWKALLIYCTKSSIITLVVVELIELYNYNNNTYKVMTQVPHNNMGKIENI